jgi:peptide/nickel transport system permease protein
MAPLTWLGRRLLGGAITVAVVVTIVFALIHAAPGSPLTTLDDQQLPAEMAERVRRDFGLDRPVLVQYSHWLLRVARGDLGISLSQQRPVRAVLAAALPHTLVLAAAALLLMLALGVGIALLQAARPWSRRDRMLSLVSVTLFSTPVFWLGAMLLAAFAIGTGWFPAGGARDVTLGPDAGWLTLAADRLYHLVLPAFTLGLAGAGLIARYQRTALLEVLAMDFIRTARAKGLSPRAVLWRHALPNALLPTITLLGLIAPALLSGAVLVETVFAWPGMGRVTADAILRRDYPVVAGATLVAAILVVLSTIVADALTRWADPRTRGAA